MVTVSSRIIIACWITFLVYWVISALRVKATAEHQSEVSAAAHRIPVGLGWFLLLYQGLPPPMNLVVLPRADWALVLGVVICVFGLFVTIWARRTLAGNWSSDVTFKQGHELVKSGPYRFVRHPIYTALLSLYSGTAIVSGELHALIGLALAILAYLRKIRLEEANLMKAFDADYRDYRRETWALLPGLF